MGERLLREVFQKAGYRQLHSVSEQAKPDPDFPTVAFPNPEETGTMDRVLNLAKQIDADLVLANDPDADRLAVAVPGPGGNFIQLSGNEVGILLGAYLIEHGAASQITRCTFNNCKLPAPFKNCQNQRRLLGSYLDRIQVDDEPRYGSKPR